jgi:hypothetical protein
MPLWGFTEEDILRGLRRQDLPVRTLADLTAKERGLVHQHADCALTEATRQLVDSLAARIRRERDQEEKS